jgi:hypothetical protein
MTEVVQPLITHSTNQRTMYPGLDVTGFDTQIGTGASLINITLDNQQWLLHRHTAAGDDVYAQILGSWGMVHSLLDPLIQGPNHILVFQETIVIDFQVATQGRIFFGLGAWTDVTNDDTLRGIGFYCDHDTQTWFALLSDALGDRVRLNTAIDVTTRHHLRLEIDGILHQVRFFLDGNQVAAHTLVIPLDQIATGTTLDFYQLGLRSTGELIQGYMSGGAVDQVLLITNEPEAAPVVTGQLTYQDIINLARTRASEFAAMVLDDQQVFKELNAMCLEMVQEGSDADHTTFQEVMNWATTVLPTIGTIPAPTDLRDVDHIEVPLWVNTIYAAEGVKANGKKIEIDIRKKESETRDRPVDEESVIFSALRDPRTRKPRAFKVWDSARSIWKLFKDENLAVPGANPWTDIIDANLIVSGVRVQMFARGDLTNTLPLPYRALRPLAEAYAVTLGMRANKDRGWIQDQRAVTEAAMTQFREFINMMDMATDEPFDPEIGMS